MTQPADPHSRQELEVNPHFFIHGWIRGSRPEAGKFHATRLVLTNRAQRLSGTVVSYFTPSGIFTGTVTLVPNEPSVRVIESTATNAV